MAMQLNPTLGSEAPSLLEQQARVPDHVVVGRSSRALSQVLRRGVNLGVWLRERPSTGQLGSRHKDWRGLFEKAATSPLAIDTLIDMNRSDSVVDVVPTGIDEGVRHAIADDIDRLTALFSRLSGRRHLRIKLHRCDGDECRQFHVDHVPLRLITTYAGPGTDWLEDGAARREHLGGRGLPRGSSIHDVNNAIVADWSRVHRLPRFAVALFRGATMHGAHAPLDGIVHRSPPIAGSGIKRLLLVIDLAVRYDACSS
jgi:hypothetical protein